VVKIKAQLTIQYLASFIFFVGLVVLIYLSFSANIPRFVEEVNKEDTRSKAYQLSEILINDPGYPIYWSDADVERIGLSDNSNKSNLIGLNKLEEFNAICSNPNGFYTIQKKLALNRSFSIFIFNITDDGSRYPLASCSPSVFPKSVINATVKRITGLNNQGKIELVEVIVQM